MRNTASSGEVDIDENILGNIIRSMGPKGTHRRDQIQNASNFRSSTNRPHPVVHRKFAQGSSGQQQRGMFSQHPSDFQMDPRFAKVPQVGSRQPQGTGGTQSFSYHSFPDQQSPFEEQQPPGRLLQQVLQPGKRQVSRANLQATLEAMNKKIRELQARLAGPKSAKSDEYDHIAQETIRAKEIQAQLEDEKLQVSRRQIQYMEYELEEKRKEEMELNAELYFLEHYGSMGVRYRPLPKGYYSNQI